MDFFLILERGKWGNIIERLPMLLRHAYALAIVLIGWVFFRCDAIADAFAYIKTMFACDFSPMHYLGITEYLDQEFWVLFTVSILGCFPIMPALIRRFKANSVLGYIADIGLLGIFAFAVFYMVGTDYNPFIYFRF